MNPNAELLDLLDALTREDWDQVHTVAMSLLNWLKDGGYPPLTIGPPHLGVKWHRDLAMVSCQMALNRVGDVQRRLTSNA